MKEPLFLAVPRFVPCNQYISFLADQGVNLGTGLGTIPVNESLLSCLLVKDLQFIL
jgi:hypothetical protein